VKLKKDYQVVFKGEEVNDQFSSPDIQKRQEDIKQEISRLPKLIKKAENVLADEMVKFLASYPALQPKGMFEKTAGYEDRKKDYEAERADAMDKALANLSATLAGYREKDLSLKAEIRRLQGAEKQKWKEHPMCEGCKIAQPQWILQDHNGPCFSSENDLFYKKKGSIRHYSYKRK
jgi:hypothetical protein